LKAFVYPVLIISTSLTLISQPDGGRIHKVVNTFSSWDPYFAV
jgi:hypothetical protein